MPRLAQGVRRRRRCESAEGRTWPTRSPCCGNGITAGTCRRCRPRSPSTGAKRSAAASPTRRGRPASPPTRSSSPRRPPEQLLQALAAASDKLAKDFGSWKTPWGDINRYQRLNGDIVQPFNDAAPSIPVGFTSSRWGSLASFGARTYPGTKKMYGNTGNSFVAVVEFGDRVRAQAITAGGESGDPASRHFNDQALRYSTGDLRDVYFYRADVEKHVERQYHPGQ